MNHALAVTALELLNGPCFIDIGINGMRRFLVGFALISHLPSNFLPF